MTIRPIITVPDPLLKEISKPVEAVTDETRRLMDDMLDTMYAANGIGLAAIQIGVPLRVIVMDLDWSGERPEGADEVRKPRYFVNPELVGPSAQLVPYEEGCLSVPGIYESVERPDTITIKYLDYNGNPHEELAEGLFATCIQHEMDHLNGIVFLDHLSRLRRDRALAKVKKFKRQDAA